MVGIEIVDGSRYNDTLIGNDGADTLRCGDGDDELFGKGGNDQLGGKLGLDRLYGQGGDDVLSEVDTGNLLHGGEGRDQAFFRGANGSLSVDLAASTATLDGLASTLVSIEDIVGANGVNRLYGDGKGNLLTAGASMTSWMAAAVVTG